MQNSLFEMTVEVDGHRIKEFGHNGRTYVEGRKGKSFTLKIKNNSAERVLFVPSVDGLSVMDGKPATPESTGYVLPGYSSMEIKGWRTSLTESAKFSFSKKESSYAGKTVGKENCGIIGCLVYAEKQKVVEKHVHHHHNNPVVVPQPYPVPYPVWPHPYWIWIGDTWCQSTTGVYTTSNSTSATFSCSTGANSAPENHTVMMNSCSFSNDQPDYNLGVSFGETQEDTVTTTDFERGPLVATLEIRFTDSSGLKKIGINPSKTPAIEAGPKAFTAFCQPPK